jgi:hypothetical protein
LISIASDNDGCLILANLAHGTGQVFTSGGISN